MGRVVGAPRAEQQFKCKPIAVHLLDDNRWRFVGTAGVPNRYPLPKKGEILELHYLYCHPGAEGKLIQAKYFGEVSDDIQPVECTVSQLKVKAGDRSQSPTLWHADKESNPNPEVRFGDEQTLATEGHMISFTNVDRTSDICHGNGVVQAFMNPQPPGEQLRKLRIRLGISTRDVESRSQRIAEEEKNQEFQISNAWLTQLENSDSVPSIFKAYSLAAIYHVKFTDLLLCFGLDLQKVAQHQLLAPLPNTHLTTLEVYDTEKTVSFPVRFDRSFDIDNTNLLTRMVEIWGEVPIALLQHLDLRHSLYGYIGLQDFTLHPFLRPGSFVQIDQRVRKIQPQRWRTEFDRPIYFVELRDGYACSWCELQDGHLLLLPHPLSPCSVRRLDYGREAEIIGQVTAVAMRLVDTPSPVPGGLARLPKQV